ncbi:uncharacterized protein LOC118745327 [Rhagoletis pomonella]|uniref:uncharacterized protein LOC118745327 n=1 Tax=Rhagoletis pomonella TaxID=28610 RepID=UPI00177FB3CA|nr:uncharacterized protein LOC118745327 [Rhagoletis pomonella]
MVRAYEAFPQPYIIALDARNFSSFFWNKHQNVQKYNFQLVFFNDSPVTFALPNNTGLGGLIGEVFRVFMKRVNGTYSIYPMTDEFISRMDMSGNLLVPVEGAVGSVDFSYPLYQTQICLMLPVEREIPHSWYLWYIFDTFTWSLLSLTFLNLVMLVCFIGWRHDNNHFRDVGLYILVALKLFLTHPLSTDRVFSVKRRLFLALFCGLFMILVNIYISSLTSLLSAGARMPKIRTTGDFLKTDLKIMNAPSERELYFETDLLPRSLASRLHEFNSTIIEENRLKANSCYAYLVSTEKWLWYKKQQAHLQHPYLRIASDELCTPSLHQIFFMKKKSPFKETIKLLGLELQEFGFVNHWLEGIPPTAKPEISNATSQDKEPLKVEHYKLAFCILGVGWSLALFAFTAELFKWRQKEIF